MKKAYLHCVSIRDLETGNRTNHNKFYYMEQIDSDNWHARAGRFGGHETVYGPYPMYHGKNSWDRKYNEKTQKVRNGYIYIDVTRDLTEATTDDGKEIVTTITDPLIDRLIQALSRYARKSVSEDYRVLAKNVTQSQVDKAQDTMDKVSGLLSDMQDNNIAIAENIDEINDMLVYLYNIIPRRMNDVNDYVVKSNWRFNQANTLIENEQKRLDVMAQQVTETHSDIKEGESILDTMGISIVKANDEDLAEVMKYVDDPAKVRNVYRVVNHKTQGSFNEFLKTVDRNRIKKYHGSHSKNWLGIITEGLIIRQSYTNGRAFGNGLYFGSFFKSLMYTDGGRYSNPHGYMGLYDINMGEIYEIRGSRSSWYNRIHNELHRDGKQYHSVWAVAGHTVDYDEWVVYTPAQCTIYALIELGY